MRPRTQFAKFPKYKYKVPKIQGFQNTSFLRTSTYKNAFQASEVLQPYFKSSEGISRTSLRRGVLTGFTVKIFFPTICSTQESKGFILTSYVRGQLSRVLNQEFLFFGSQVVVFTSNPSCLKYWLLRFLFYEEAMCKGSTRNGLLYTAKAVP
jgi:hypothetical protein